MPRDLHLDPPLPAPFGLVVLQADLTIEDDMRRLLPSDRSLLVTRVPSGEDVTLELDLAGEEIILEYEHDSEETYTPQVLILSSQCLIELGYRSAGPGGDNQFAGGVVDDPPVLGQRQDLGITVAPKQPCFAAAALHAERPLVSEGLCDGG